MTLVCIVEGHGEVQAVPVLIRRFAPQIKVRTLRVNKDRFLKKGILEREVETAGQLAGPNGGILILLDSDRDCPAKLGPTVMERAQQARSDRRIVVAIARTEFENWFLAAAKSLRGKRGFSRELEPPPNPEAVRGAKEWLARNRGGIYSETIDQPALAQLFDFGEARTGSPSFLRFERRMLQLIEDMTTSGPSSD